MTTPSVDKDVQTLRIGNYSDWIGNHHTQQCLATRVTEKRPSSVSTGFGGKSRNSWRNPTSWYHNGSSFESSPGTARFNVPGHPEQWAQIDGGSYWNYIQTLARDITFPNQLRSQAETEALLRLKNQHVNVGNFLAEGRDTVRMVSSAAKDISRQVTDFRTKFPKLWDQVKKWETGRTAKKYWRCIPAAWLELQYGWKPLMSDIQGAASSLDSGFAGGKEMLVGVSGHAKGQDNVDFNCDGIYWGFHTPYRRYVEQFCKCCLYYTLAHPSLAKLSSLGLVNPAEVVWEVLPYSFVVDWFIPVSDWLSALTGDLGYDFKSGTLSKITKVSELRAGPVYPVFDPTSGLDFSGDGARFTSRSYSMTRTVYGASPMPGFYLKNPISSGHLANATALLIQAFH